MVHVMPALLPFFCLVSFDNYRSAEANLSAGCEQFAVWENAWQDPVWRFFHCPDAAKDLMQFEGIVVNANRLKER